MANDTNCGTGPSDWLCCRWSSNAKDEQGALQTLNLRKLGSRAGRFRNEYAICGPTRQRMRETRIAPHPTEVSLFEVTEIERPPEGKAEERGQRSELRLIV